MTVSVWVQEWQFACCEGPFTVGDVVHWRISPDLRAGGVPDLGGDEAHVAGVEDHHDSLPDLAPLTGRITEILTPAAGGRLVHVHSSGDRPAVPGWLVRLDVDPASMPPEH